MLTRFRLPLQGPEKRPAGRSPAPGPAGPPLAVCGAHGGAGTTTLAALLDPAYDLGRVRIDAVSPALGLARMPGPLLLACRPTTWSAELATAAVSALAGAGHQVAVLVIAADGWPETPVAAARYRMLSARVRSVVRMPFVPALRGCPDPSSVRLPRNARRALDRILQITTTAAPGETRPVLAEVHHDDHR